MKVYQLTVSEKEFELLCAVLGESFECPEGVGCSGEIICYDCWKQNFKVEEKDING